MGAFRFEGGLAQKPVPPIVVQPRVTDEFGITAASPTCWAAALSSWLKGVRGTDWSVSDLVQRFRPYLRGSGLDLANFDEIAGALSVRMTFEDVSPQDLTWEYLYEKLMISSVYIILAGKDPGHAVVIYSIAFDSAGTRDVRWMDPLKGSYQRGPLAKFQTLSRNFVVGWASDPWSAG